MIPGGDPHDVERQARAGQRRAPPKRAADAYRLSLDGWRALERGDLTAAGAALERSLALEADDPVTRYRLARLLDARAEIRPAIDLYERVMSATRTPPAFFAAAALDAARLYEREGDRTRAVELYERARASFGGSTATREAAARALARLDPARTSADGQEAARRMQPQR
jgi:tetratricopeptide (TPR) repeat protein